MRDSVIGMEGGKMLGGIQMINESLFIMLLERETAERRIILGKVDLFLGV